MLPVTATLRRRWSVRSSASYAPLRPPPLSWQTLTDAKTQACTAAHANRRLTERHRRAALRHTALPTLTERIALGHSMADLAPATAPLRLRTGQPAR